MIGGCVATGHPTSPAPQAAFDPIDFFTGHTEGTGTLKVALHRRESTLVEGNGHVTPEYGIVLDQVVRRGDRPATRRQWVLRETAPGRYRGTVSDAAGPVAGTIDNGTLHLSFRMRGGLDAEQWLSLTTDGGGARNVMVIRKLGIPVARLDEDIRKVGG